MLTYIFPLRIFFADSSNPNPYLQFLPVLGVLIVFLCLIALFIPKTKWIAQKTQRFTGLGVSMELSMLTIFVLMGFILSLSSFFLQWKGYLDQQGNYDKEIERLNGQIKASDDTIDKMREEADKSKTVGMRLNLIPKPYARLTAADLSCTYQIVGSEVKNVNLLPGASSNSFVLPLDGITKTTTFSFILIEHRKSGQRWQMDDYKPFEPILYLEEVKAND
ncbi:MAG TPA: hypothetical protein VGC91_08740 [Pyrinomonadaceae bacterium]